MSHFKYTILLFMAMLPFVASALEPIFKLKNQTIMLASAPSTIGVAYKVDALSSNDFSKHHLSDVEFAGKTINVTDVNIIDWDKKSQALIVEFEYQGNDYCFYFPQIIKTSHVTKKRPYTRFYVGSYMDSYQNTDETHYVKPKDICISYWLASDVEFLNSKINSKFRWNRDIRTSDSYIFTAFDPSHNKFQYREFHKEEIKPSNSSTHNIYPRKTIKNGYGIYDIDSSLEYLLKKLYWIE